MTGQSFHPLSLSENRDTPLQETFETILAHLHRGGAWSYWWIDKGRKSTWWPVGDWLPIPNGRANVYFGVHPVAQIPTTNTKGKPVPPNEARGQNKHISAINCLFGDFDAKDFGNDKDNVLFKVGELDPLPTLTIDSGGGYHCYWFLSLPFRLETEENRKRAIDIQGRWVNFVGADNAVKDLSRVFRVPGTRNFKNAYAPQFPIVSILEFDEKRQYNLDDLEKLLPIEKPGIQSETGLALSDDDIIMRAMTSKNGKKFTQLWSGSTAGYQSASEADIALCCMLAFWTGKDAERMNKIFRASGLYRDKWERDDYREHTIERAIEITKETYTPSSPKTADYIAALERLGYTFRMNICNDMIEVNQEPMSDPIRSKIRSQLRDVGYDRVNIAEDAWVACAFDNSYHPVRDYLAGLKWDGKDTMGELVSHIQDDRHFLPVFLRRWLIGAVARAFEPNSTQNRLLALDGDQGIGKSFFVRWLAAPIGRPETFIEGPINPDDKDSLIRLMSCWIWEVSEIGSTTRRADREALKYFLSIQRVTARKPYGHYDIVKPALSSFIGTVNSVGGFLNDPTGYRRFMSAKVSLIDWNYTSLDANQVWAQAKALYDQGEPWDLIGEELRMAKESNIRYEIDDPLEDLITKLYKITGNSLGFVPTIRIIEDLHDCGWRIGKPRAESMAIAAAMKMLGVQKKPGTSKPRGYIGLRISS